MKYKTIYPVGKEGGTWKFRVWAPHAHDLRLILTTREMEVPMEQKDSGYWEATVNELESGDRYRYRIDHKKDLPDPASLSQPEGVHADSELIGLDNYNWSDQDYRQLPLNRMIQYEIHTGTFSEKGNFQGIIDKLDYLEELGVNTIELMPVAQFSGHRNWGYDGTYPFAVHHSYGGAAKLMDLVNACHRKGMAVILDVVYNHLGPEGNYLSQFGPYFSGKYSTPWGNPLNFDDAYSDSVRDYFIQNAMMWIRDFHIDALRLDAIHAIYDHGAVHILEEIARHLKDYNQSMNKNHSLIAESNLNDVRYINPPKKGGYGLDAQWSDDFHHSIHALTTGEKNGYYMDYGTPDQLVKAIRDAFVFDGKEYSQYRKQTYGNSTQENPGEQFVIFHQNHDQIGNRMLGERLISLTGFETAKLVAGTLLFSSNIPMIFMGEEYGETNPFLYFVSHLDPELNRRVKKGREKEFAGFLKKGVVAPDPSDPETFERSKLSWDFDRKEERSAMLRFYKRLISLRKRNELFGSTNRDRMIVRNDNTLLTAEKREGEHKIVAFMNYGSNEAHAELPQSTNKEFQKLLESGSEEWMGPGDLGPDLCRAGELITILQNSIVIYSNQEL